MASGNFEFSASGVLQGKIEWSSSSNGASANSSNVTATLYARRTNSYTTTGKTWSGYVKVGSAQTNISFDSAVSVSNNWVQMATVTTTISHNEDGSGSTTISGSVTGPGSTALSGNTSSGSQNVTLDKIARYFTSYDISLTFGTTTATVKWSCNPACDKLSAIIGSSGGATSFNASGTSGTQTIGGLTPGTYYEIRIGLRRADSGLWSYKDFSGTTIGYPTCTQTFSSKTETSITMKWSSDSTIDYVWYSKDNGSNWTAVGTVNATSGSYTINGLSANTSYNIKTRVRAKSTQLTKDSSNSSQTTYAYPYCTSAPNFTVGSNVTIQFYNPLNRSIQIQMYSRTSSSFVSDLISCSGTSYTGFSNIADKLYASIPNANSGSYNIDVHYGSNKAVKQGGTYSTNVSKISPTFTSFNYQDSNSDVVAVTGDNQCIVKGKSNLQVIIPTANKMVAQKSASGKYYLIRCDTRSTSVNYSDSKDITANLGTIINSGNKEIIVQAYDTRSNSIKVSKTINVYNYSAPIINATAIRKNNFETETTLSIKGTYSILKINDEEKNSIQKVTYTYKESNSTEEGTTGEATITNNSGDYECANITLTLDNTKRYTITVTVTDKLSTTTQSYTVDIGIPIFYIDAQNSKVGVNKITDSSSEALDINGNVKANDYKGSINGYAWDCNTKNTTSLFVPVYNDTDKKIQYRSIPRAYDSTSPTLGTVTGTNFVGKTNGYTWSLGTQNTSNTNVPVINGTTLQYRSIPATYNSINPTLGSVELKSATPYIDFHFNNSTTDYTSRIIESASGNLVVSGLLSVRGSTNYRVYGGRVLYSNSSGTTGNVTLSETAGNFNFMQIVFSKSGGITNSTIIYSPNNSHVSLITGFYGGDTYYTGATWTQTQIAEVIISGTTISWLNRGGMNIPNGESPFVFASTELKIYYVIGFR